MGLLTLFTDFFCESPPQLALFSERCLRSRLSTNQCQRCLQNCLFGALSLNNGKVVLDSTQCTGCMSCVAECPQDALVCDYHLDELFSSQPAWTDIVVSCVRQAPNHPEEIAIPCVGILSKQVLAAIFLSDCKSVTINLVGCAACCNQPVSKDFLANCRQVMAEFSDINSTKMFLVEKREQLTNPGMNRRSYLSKIRDFAVDISKQGFFFRQVPPLAETKRSRRIPFKTRLVKKLLTNLPENSQKKILRLFGHNLSINASCNCCPLCKGICPTGAIKIDRSDQGKSLKFEMLDCNGCGLCVEFCKKNALSLKRFT